MNLKMAQADVKLYEEIVRSHSKGKHSKAARRMPNDNNAKFKSRSR